VYIKKKITKQLLWFAKDVINGDVGQNSSLLTLKKLLLLYLSIASPRTGSIRFFGNYSSTLARCNIQQTLITEGPGIRAADRLVDIRTRFIAS